MFSTRSFSPTRQGNPCLVCSDTQGKCSQTSEDLNLCMTFSGYLLAFRYIGQSKDGNWGKYFIDDGTWTQDNRDRHFQEQQQLRAQCAVAQRHADALPAIERDRLYTQLLNQLPLHPEDQADLNRRGLTDEQIASAGFKSVEQWQPLAIELSNALPGLSLDGRSQATYQLLVEDSEHHQDIANVVSQNPLKRLTRTKNKSLIDQSKEVMSDKWCFKRKKTPTWKKEF